jgi:hypothetical protein
MVSPSPVILSGAKNLSFAQDKPLEVSLFLKERLFVALKGSSE